MKKKRTILIAALIMVLTVTMALPGVGYAAEEYDPTKPSFQQESDNEVTEESTQTQVQEEEITSSESTAEVEPATETETTTEAKTEPVYKGTNAKKIPVITYHRLCSDAEKRMRANKKDSLFISVSVFEKQMAWLSARGYRTISTEEFYKWRTGRISLPPKSVLITFDDGIYSIVKYGVPVLKKYNMKATMFIIGKNIKPVTNRKANSRGRYCCIGQDVINEVTADYPDFEFQSHTYNMHRKIKKKPALTKTSKGAQISDFTTMYKKYGYTVMAYPYGKYTNKTIAAAKASHVKMAFTYGTNAYATKKQSIYKIKRIKISGTQSMKKFYRWFK